MNTIIHICFSHTTREQLKIAISKNLIKEGNVIELLDDLSKGPIKNINDISTRINWSRNFQFAYNYDRRKSLIISSYKDYYSTINSITNEEIYIWYGDNCVEVCGLLYTLTLLNKKTNNLNFVRSLPTFSEDYNSACIYKGTHEITFEKLFSFFNKSFKLTSYEISSLINLWSLLSNENTNIRLVNSPQIDHLLNENESKENRWPTILDKYFINPIDAIKKIESVNEDYYDNLILEKVTFNYSNSAFIIGNVLGEITDNISDSFIFYRILNLIKIGKLDYVGNLNSIRDLKIRLNNY